jgi:hypothetical protein
MPIGLVECININPCKTGWILGTQAIMEILMSSKIDGILIFKILDMIPLIPPKLWEKVVAEVQVF